MEVGLNLLFKDFHQKFQAPGGCKSILFRYAMGVFRNQHPTAQTLKCRICKDRINQPLSKTTLSISFSDKKSVR
jgi:hypothetical protein